LIGAACRGNAGAAAVWAIIMAIPSIRVPYCNAPEAQRFRRVA
jgi:hypothetical protein